MSENSFWKGRKKHYEELLADSAELPFAKEELAAAHYRFGKISLELGNTDDARRELVEAEREQRNQLAEKQGDKDRMLSLANTLTEVAKVRQTDQEFENLSAVRREVLDLRLRVLSKSASNNELRRLAASARMNLGIALREEGQLAPALKELELAQVEREAILNGDETQHKTRRDFAQGAFNLALLYLKFNAKDGNTDSMKNALKQFDIAIGNFEKLSQLQPRVLSHRLNLEQTLRTKATHEPMPDVYYARADQVNQKLMDENPDVVEYRIEAGQLKLERGAYFASVSNWDQAIESYRECEATLKELAKKDAEAIDYLATSLLRLSEAEQALGKTQDAIASLENSRGWWEVLIKQTPSDPYLKENLDQVNAMLSRLNASTDSRAKSQP